MRSGGRGRVASNSPKAPAGGESDDGEGPTENWEKGGRKEAERVPGMGQAVATLGRGRTVISCHKPDSRVAGPQGSRSQTYLLRRFRLASSARKGAWELRWCEEEGKVLNSVTFTHQQAAGPLATVRHPAPPA